MQKIEKSFDTFCFTSFLGRNSILLYRRVYLIAYCFFAELCRAGSHKTSKKCQPVAQNSQNLRWMEKKLSEHNQQVGRRAYSFVYLSRGPFQILFPIHKLQYQKCRQMVKQNKGSLEAVFSKSQSYDCSLLLFSITIIHPNWQTWHFLVAFTLFLIEQIVFFVTKKPHFLTVWISIRTKTS